MLILLCTGIVKLSNVEKTSDFLIDIMPLMFIPGGVKLITVWNDVKPILLPLIVITAVSTVIVMAVTGKTTELIMKSDKRLKERKK